MAVQVAALGMFLWSVTQRLPRASREGDTFGIVCTAITGLLALALFLFVGIRAR
jgi:hypothetical protein